MIVCPACQAKIPADSRFCGLCGFRLTPITVEAHRTLSRELALGPVREQLEAEGEVVPLTRRKTTTPQPAEVVPLEKPRLVVMADDVALDDTMPRAAGPAVDAGLEDTSPAGRRGQRRAAKRFPLKVEVSYGSEHNFYTGFVENMSSGGLFVATHDPVSIGELYELTFSVPGLNRSCTATCEVRWVREYNPLAPDTVPGMGLRFKQLDPDARAAIELFIRHRDPIFFDDEL